MGKRYIIIASLLACVFMYFIEQVVMVDYVIKTLLKIIVFTSIPIIYFKLFKKSTIVEALNLNKLDKKQLKIGLILGLISFAVVLIAYQIAKGFMDIEGIVKELEQKSNITPTNFLLVGLYITFGNSFLEEFFFRGFIFLNLYESKNKVQAYLYSALLFSLYHIGIFRNWFNIWLTLLAVLGLVAIGLVFNWLNTKSKNFLNSWIVHILADIAIIIVGMRIMGMI